MKKLEIAQLEQWLNTLAGEKTVYLPVEEADQVNYAAWAEGKTARLDCLRTVKSAKDVFFPQVENLLRMRMDGKKIEVHQADLLEEEFVVLGVRACDLRSFEILDRVFLSDPVDPFYQARREHGTVVTLACSQPDENCFCTNFGIDATDPLGDATMWLVGDALYLRANTEKGEALLASLPEGAGEDKVEKQQAATRKILENLPFGKLNLAGFDGEHLMEKFDSPKWAELSRACLGCGTCTFVCPTCQCYDIRDFDTGSGVQRYRCWDSCMYSDFTLMAHGNCRPTQLERFRQRFMHKLVYFPANNEGIYGCVGCGRCLSKCPQSINIVKVIKALGGNKA